MTTFSPRHYWTTLPAIALLAACASQPPAPPDDDVPVSSPRIEVKVDETAMLPLLGYLQLLPRMSVQELNRERTTLAALPQTPSVRLRQAMVFGQVKGPVNLSRAQSLLNAILKSSDPAANSLHPLARALSGHYSERQRLEQQNTRLSTQTDELAQQLKDSQRRNDELQQKINALADIERSLPARPSASETQPGTSR